jgi:hypothetical protein
VALYDDVPTLDGKAVGVRSGEPNPYRRLDGRKRWAGADGGWMHTSHLLVVKTRWLREHYTRLYWHDIQGIALYELPGLSALGIALETICLLTYATYAFLFGSRVAMSCGAVFLLLYGIARWRMERFVYAVYTRVNVAYMPGGASKAKSMKGLTAMDEAVRHAQGAAASNGAAGQTIGPAATGRPAPRLWPHSALFVTVFALYSAALLFQKLQTAEVIGLGLGAVAILLPLLIATAAIQKNFEFPASIRIFAWFYQFGTLVGVLQLLTGIWIPFSRLHGSRAREVQAAAALLPAICGLVMIYLESAKRQPAMSDTLSELGLR